MTFLATTASACPFIGLFGTVWGIMQAFRAIGMTGSTSIVAVAPGISEALVNTAAGLAAAIPALIFYNYFMGKVRAAARRHGGLLPGVHQPRGARTSPRHRVHFQAATSASGDPKDTTWPTSTSRRWST